MPNPGHSALAAPYGRRKGEHLIKLTGLGGSGRLGEHS